MDPCYLDSCSLALRKRVLFGYLSVHDCSHLGQSFKNMIMNADQKNWFLTFFSEFHCHSPSTNLDTAHNWVLVHFLPFKGIKKDHSLVRGMLRMLGFITMILLGPLKQRCSQHVVAVFCCSSDLPTPQWSKCILRPHSRWLFIICEKVFCILRSWAI